jgi:hypothetical protein
MLVIEDDMELAEAIALGLRRQPMAGTNPKGGHMQPAAIIGEATTTVRATPDEIINFVLDLERYRQADHKIGRVGAIERHGTTGTARFGDRLRGLPGPSLHDHRLGSRGARRAANRHPLRDGRHLTRCSDR